MRRLVLSSSTSLLWLSWVKVTIVVFLWFIFAYADELNSDSILLPFFFSYFVRVLTFPASQPSSAVRLAVPTSAVYVSSTIFLNLLSIR